VVEDQQALPMVAKVVHLDLGVMGSHLLHIPTMDTSHRELHPQQLISLLNKVLCLHHSSQLQGVQLDTMISGQQILPGIIKDESLSQLCLNSDAGEFFRLDDLLCLSFVVVRTRN
jgi:hypothetical protein